MTIWKKLPFSEKHFINNSWEIKSTVWTTKILKPYINKKGYAIIMICNKNYSVHRLMWLVFLWLNLQDTKTFVCHKDDNPSNNHIDNLFLWTHSDNMQDMINKGRWWWALIMNWQWDKHPQSKLTKDNVIQIRDMLSNWTEPLEIANTFKVSQGHICNIRDKRTWQHL